MLKNLIAEQAVTIGLVGFGAMGSGVASSLSRSGFNVATTLEGRSTRTRSRAEQIGITVHDSLGALVDRADLIVSLVPADQATAAAEAVAQHLLRPSQRQRPERLLFLDANAITPSKATRIAEIVSAAGAAFLDGCIIGPPPQPSKSWTRVYVSGEGAAALCAMANDEMTITDLGSGRVTATQLKVLFAAINKGTVALLANVFAAARLHGLEDRIRAELSGVRPELIAILEVQAAGVLDKAARWAIEMEDLAEGLVELGVDGGYHTAAAQGYRRLAENLLRLTDDPAAPAEPLDRLLANWLLVSDLGIDGRGRG